MKHFVDCIVNNKKPMVGREDGYKTIEMAYAANEALKSHNVIFMK